MQTTIRKIYSDDQGTEYDVDEGDGPEDPHDRFTGRYCVHADLENDSPAVTVCETESYGWALVIAENLGEVTDLATVLRELERQP